MFGKKNKGVEKKGDESWKNLSKFAAFVITVVFAVYISNSVFNYIPLDSKWLNIIKYCIFYGPIVVCALTAVASVSNKGFIIRVAVLAVWILIFLFLFFPDIFSKIIH